MRSRFSRRVSTRPGRNPDRPRDPAAAAAIARVAAFRTRLSHLPRERFELLALRPIDHERHVRARNHAELIAAESGRDALLAETRASLREWYLLQIAEGTLLNSVYPFLSLQPVGRAGDHGTAIQALQDVGAAVLLEDVLADDIYGELVGPLAPLVEA